MFKRVLVPLDTSKLAEIVLPYAEEMAIKFSSEIVLLHVRTPADAPDNPEHRAYMSKTAGEVEQRIKKTAGLPPGEKVKVVSVVVGAPHIINHPAEEILNYAEKENINLIMIATHGWTGIRRWALGSTANNVARVTTHPLLLVRAKMDVPRSVHMEKILVPLDGSQPGEVVLPYIESLVAKLKSEVSLLNVVEPPYHFYPYADGLDYYGGAGIVRIPYTEEEIKPLRETAVKYIKSVSDKLIAGGVKAKFEVRVGSTGEEITKVETETHPDLVVMSTHGHSGFGRLDHGSITDKVLHHGNAPLLLIRPRKPQ
jgi:nucleotide-binding universal stress UspA family protein